MFKTAIVLAIACSAVAASVNVTGTVPRLPDLGPFNYSSGGTNRGTVQAANISSFFRLRKP